MINHIYRLIILPNYKIMRNILAFFVLFLLKDSAPPPNTIPHKESIVSSRPPRLFSLCHAFIVICLLILTGVTREKKSEKEVILEALIRHGGSRALVAEELGIHRSTLWRKIKGYGMDG